MRRRLWLLSFSLQWHAQNPVLRDYPAQLSATALTYIFGTIQLAIIAICVERDLDTWATTFYLDLPAILYGVCGIQISVFNVKAQIISSWTFFWGAKSLVRLRYVMHDVNAGLSGLRGGNDSARMVCL